MPTVEMRRPATTTGLLFAAIGLVEGLAWWATDALDPVFLRIARLPMCLVFFVSSVGLVARFTWTGRDLRRWIAVAGGLGLAVAAITWSVWGHLPAGEVEYAGDKIRGSAWIMGVFALLYVATPFAQIFQRSGRRQFPYPGLFEHSWNNFFIGMVAWMFSGAFWLVLMVWAGLFKVIEIDFFAELFEREGFRYVATFTTVGYGFALGRTSERIISTMRRIALMTAHALLPLVAFVALLFLGALAFTGLEPLWETRSATTLVLTLMAFIVVMFNGVFEDGEADPPYPSWVRGLLRATLLALPAYAAIAYAGTKLRVDQYGLTTQRVYALVFDGVAAIYALGYAGAALSRTGPWLGLVRQINVRAALIVAGLLILLQLYPLDPMRLSAANQSARLATEDVQPADFDFATMRFRLGHYGWDALAKLEDMVDHPQAVAIADEIAFVRAAEAFWAAGNRREPLTLERMTLLPADMQLPDAVFDLMAEQTRESFDNCEEDGVCTVLAADLDGDGTLEYCFVGDRRWYQPQCWGQSATGEWESIGHLAYRGEAGRPDREALVAALGDGPIEVRPSPYGDIVLPEGVFQLVR